MIYPKYKRGGIGLISDLHAGSPFGPWPYGIDESRKDQGEVPILPTPNQLVLKEYLHDLKIQFDNYDVDTVIGVGDLIHGNNRKEWGDRCRTTNFNTQSRAAIELLRPIVEGRTFRNVAGSKYHGSLDTEMEEWIAECLGGEFWGLFAIVPIKGTKLHFLVTHGESQAWVYREMILARESLFMSAAEGRKEIPFHIDAVIRGHWHVAMEVPTPDRLMLQVPGFTTWYPYRGGLKSYGKLIPQIGGTVLLIDRDDQITVRHITYPRPLIADKPVEAI